jgi:putative MATE family efflux protein
MKNQNQNILDSDRVGRLMITLTVPLFFGTFVQVVYNVMDTIFIGHYVGSLGLAALSVVFPLQMFAMGLGQMVGIGGASLMSRLIGSDDKRGAERALGNGITAGILLAVLMTVAVLPNISFWIKLIGASENVFPYARDFLTIIMSGTLFNVLANALIFYVRSEGNTRVAMIAMILAFGLNTVLDAIFMIPLHMGIKGAALATVISLLVATLYALSYYFTKSSYLKLRLKNFVPDFKILRRIFAVGVAQLSQTVSTSVAALFIIKMAASYGGDLALSAFGIIQRILYFAMMPGMVIGQGMQPVLGYNYGARRYGLALRTMTLACISATIFSILAFLVLYLFPDTIIRVFTSDQSLIEECTYVTRKVFLALPVVGFFSVGSQIFLSLGKAVESFIIAVVRPAVFLLPLVLILPRFLGLDGVWISFPSSDGLTFLLVTGLMIPLINYFRKAASKKPEFVVDSVSSSIGLDYEEPDSVTK